MYIYRPIGDWWYWTVGHLTSKTLYGACNDSSVGPVQLKGVEPLFRGGYMIRDGKAWAY